MQHCFPSFASRLLPPLALLILPCPSAHASEPCECESCTEHSRQLPPSTLDTPANDGSAESSSDRHSFSEKCSCVQSSCQIRIAESSAQSVEPRTEIIVAAGYGNDFRRIEDLPNNEGLSAFSTEFMESPYIRIDAVSERELARIADKSPVIAIVFADHVLNFDDRVQDRTNFGGNLKYPFSYSQSQGTFSIGTGFERQMRGGDPSRDIASVALDAKTPVWSNFTLRGAVTRSYLTSLTEKPDRTATRFEFTADLNRSDYERYRLRIRTTSESVEPSYLRRDVNSVSLESNWRYDDFLVPGAIVLSSTYSHAKYGDRDPQWGAIREDLQISGRLSLVQTLANSNELSWTIGSRDRDSNIESIKRRSNWMEVSLKQSF